MSCMLGKSIVIKYGIRKLNSSIRAASEDLNSCAHLCESCNRLKSHVFSPGSNTTGAARRLYSSAPHPKCKNSPSVVKEKSTPKGKSQRVNEHESASALQRSEGSSTQGSSAYNKLLSLLDCRLEQLIYQDGDLKTSLQRQLWQKRSSKVQHTLAQLSRLYGEQQVTTHEHAEEEKCDVAHKKPQQKKARERTDKEKCSVVHGKRQKATTRERTDEERRSAGIEKRQKVTTRERTEEERRGAGIEKRQKVTTRECTEEERRGAGIEKRQKVTTRERTEEERRGAGIEKRQKVTTRERTEEERRGATHGKHDGGSPRTVTMAATATSDVHRHGQSSDAVAHDDVYPIHAASENDAIRRAAPTKRLDLSVLGYDEFRCDEMDDSVENDLRLGEAAEERDHELPAVVELGFNNNLKVYVDACINTKMLSRAQTTVRFYQRRAIKHPKTNCKVSNVEIFNLLGHAWAKKGNIERIKEVFRMMREGGVLPNHQSYAAGLECLARQDMFDCDLGERILRQMEKNGLQVEAVFNKCVFHGSDREKVHEAILRIRPGIVFSLPKEYAGYATKLLTHLNVKQNKVWQDTPYLQLFTAAGLARQGRLQYEHEVTGVVGVESVEKRPPPDRHTLEMRKLLAENQIKWKKVLHTAFDRNTKVLSNKLSNTKAVNILPFLRVLRTEEFVDVMLQEVRTLAESSETFSAAMQTLYRGMGQRVLNRYTTRSKISSGLAAKIQKLYDEHLQYFIDPALTSSMNPREHWQKLLDATPEGPTVDVEDSAWPYNVLNGVGKFLYDIIIHEIKIDVSASRGKPGNYMPAFYKIYRNVGVQVKEEIKAHPALVKLVKEASETQLLFETNLLPMLAPPMPWSSIRCGSFLLSCARLIRLPFMASQQQALLVKAPPNELYPMFDSLNQLGACPWIINQPILDLIIDIFNNKGSVELDVAPPLSECPPMMKMTADMTKEQKAVVAKDRLMLKRKRAEMYSLWCDALYKLSIANHFRNDIFWFPHNMDFRGRVYPCPPHFNHLGSDLSRSMLLFAKGQPLGEHGLDWLKIQLINLTGFKKRDPVKVRLAYANEVMQEILDSADRPMTGSRWWMTSDEPWQTLACCKEVAKATRSPDPKRYVSHLPIHQDGSCNGLQHYAALGRDQHGAEQVNLHPFDKPQDVYSGVAALVESLRKKDAEDGVKIAQVLDGFVKRKVVKQTVMTVVYGVTRYGARLQILRQLKDILEFPDEHAWQASAYLVQKTFQSLAEMFTATREIQDWFTECARLISQVRGKPVQWITPLGLPIVQPYYRTINTKGVPQVEGKLTGYILSHSTNTERPNVMKQKNAFPPNYIHSLDSTHMMLTSLHCQTAGITFVSVHDCYWTHASTVAIMNRICREQFVTLHSEPLLEQLSDFMLDKYSYRDSEFPNDGSVVDITRKRLNKLLTAVPPRGKFDLKNVLTSTYFFS